MKGYRDTSFKEEKQDSPKRKKKYCEMGSKSLKSGQYLIAAGTSELRMHRMPLELNSRTASSSPQFGDLGQP